MKSFPVLAAVVILSLVVVHAELTPSMPMRSGKYIYQETVEAEGVSAAELYSRALMWSAAAYGTGPEVTKVADPAAGRLVLNGLVNVEYLSITNVDVRHTVTIEVEDGSYSYEITDFVADFGNARKPMEVQFSGRSSVKKKTHRKMEALIDLLKRQMTQSTALQEPLKPTVESK